MDNAGLNTKLQFFVNKANDFIVETNNSVAQQTVLGNSSASFGMQRSWLGTWGKQVGPDTRYGLASLAKQLNSVSVKK